MHNVWGESTHTVYQYIVHHLLSKCGGITPTRVEECATPWLRWKIQSYHPLASHKHEKKKHYLRYLLSYNHGGSINTKLTFAFTPTHTRTHTKTNTSIAWHRRCRQIQAYLLWSSHKHEYNRYAHARIKQKLILRSISQHDTDVVGKFQTCLETTGTNMKMGATHTHIQT